MAEDGIELKPAYYVLEFSTKVSHEAKLKQLLRDLHSTESKLFSDASKEFRKLINSESGPEFITFYLQTSPKCIELLQCWELHKGKPGFPQFLKLICAIFTKTFGKNEDRNKNDSVNGLDKFGRVIINQKMDDLYKELSSKDTKRQNAVLLLLASIVHRGQELALPVAKCFDFKLDAFVKLAGWKWKRKGREGNRRNLTRKAFVGFAMSFLEVGDPRLLRNILQEKNMYSGVLRGLGNDDAETITYVLETLRDKLLVPESLVPPPLRSVLFGSVTLEQLIDISGWENDGDVAAVAHSVLMKVCTDPSNGLMPDLEGQPSALKGNPKRLLDLMKKLRATETQYHKDLLLAVVKGKPALGAAYLDEFPYKLDDLASPTWVGAVSLASNVMCSVADGLVFGFLDRQLQEPSVFDHPDLQNILKCIGPQPLSRVVVNKGLLHSNPVVKHGTLRLVLEELKLFDSLIGALKGMSCSDSRLMSKMASLRHDIQNEVRMLLPDPQVLLSLLSSMNSLHKNRKSGLKRPVNFEVQRDCNLTPTKKLKSSDSVHIILGAVSSSPIRILGVNDEDPKEAAGSPRNSSADVLNHIREIWGFTVETADLAMNDGETYFYGKLLDVLKIYHCALPMAFAGAFDFFRVLPDNPLSLPLFLQRSILSLLVGQVDCSINNKVFIGTASQLFKYLLSFLKLFMYSPVREVKDLAYSLAQAAMLSTGAFDGNPWEIHIWFAFIPGYSRDSFHDGDQGIMAFQKLSSPVVSFLCDAVSAIGHNLFKYLDRMRCSLQGSRDVSPNFSPFIVCVLEKCIRLLSSESGAFSLAEKSLISLYVSTTMKYILETQVEAGDLSSLIICLLSERFDACVGFTTFSSIGCEWRPLKSLLDFSKSIIRREIYTNLTLVHDNSSNGSFSKTLCEVENILSNEGNKELNGITIGFCFSLICSTPSEILQYFPSVMSISNKLSEIPFSLLSLIFYLEPHQLAHLFKLYPEVCDAGLEKVLARINSGGENGDNVSRQANCKDSATVAFALFLKNAPFHMLFPASLYVDGLCGLGNARMRHLLLDKLSQLPADLSIYSIRHVLFVLSCARSSYKINPSIGLEKLSEFSYVVTEHNLKQCLVAKGAVDGSAHKFGPSVSYAEEVAEMIFSHPLIGETLDCPLSSATSFTDYTVLRSHESFLEYARSSIHQMDHHVLNLLKSACVLLLPLSLDNGDLSEVDHTTGRISDSFTALVLKLIRILKERLSVYVKSGDLVPSLPLLYALHSLADVILPCVLLELVDWYFSRIGVNDSVVRLSVESCVLFVGLDIAGLAFDSLSAYMGQASSNGSHPYFSKVMETGNFDCALLERVVFHVFDIAKTSELEVADFCLLKAVKVVELYKHMDQTRLPFSMSMSRILSCIPVSFLSQSRDKLSRAKAEVMYLLCKMSPLHLSFSGQLFSDMMDKSLTFKANEMEKDCRYHYSDEEFLMLVPIILLCCNHCCVKESHVSEHAETVVSFVSKIVLRGFSNWKSFVLKEIFHMKFIRCWPSSTEEFLNLVSASLLGKSVLLTQHYLNLSGCSVTLKNKLSLFKSISSDSCLHDDLLDETVSEVGVSTLEQHLDIGNRIVAKICTLEQHLDIGNRIVAKICLCRLLLFHVDIQPSSQEAEGENSEEINSSRLVFLNMMVDSWKFIIKRSHSSISNSREGEQTKVLLFRYLENFIIRNILDLTEEMHDLLIRLNSLTLIRKLSKYSLRYRFDDPATLKMLRMVLSSLSGGNFSCNSVIQLLLSHSQFSSSLLCANKSPNSTRYGLVLTSSGSIFRPANFSQIVQKFTSQKHDRNPSGHPLLQLEVVKLLRVLFQIQAQKNKSNAELCNGIKWKEIVSLLLSSYSATLAEIDVEICLLINELESLDESVSESITELDFLWGSAAQRVDKERDNEQQISSTMESDVEATEDRRNRFRENFPVDPNLCQRTVLFFPFERSSGQRSLNNLQKNEDFGPVQEYTTTDRDMEIYDPVFILRFSRHCLSMGYTEPQEFTSAGLLAVTFVSLSSPDNDMRKMGYEVLGLFKASLEKCQKRKDAMRLQLLLSFLQNCITEPLQRVPSMITALVAEASFILLDSSHDHYAAISKCLVQFPGANAKSIPLFQDFFWSSSVKFKKERSWILQLLYTALNGDDDAQTCIRNSIFEVLLSFYASPLSDNELKDLIIQVVKKSVRLPKLAKYLVKHCGLISWLSSLVSSVWGSNWKEQGRFQLARLSVIVKVVDGIFTSGNMSEWLGEHALEQLIELSSHLYKVLVSCIELKQEQASFVVLILQILTLTLKISQERQVYPQFLVGFQGLCSLVEAIDARARRFSHVGELGLRVVLLSRPSGAILNMEHAKLEKFLKWAITVALQTLPQSEASNFYSTRSSGICQENLMSELLRWMTTSVILGMLSDDSSNMNYGCHLERMKLQTLQSLLQFAEKISDSKSRLDNREILAKSIFYLQQLVGIKHELFPSVVSALVLLISSAPSSSDSVHGTVFPLGSTLAKIRCPSEANSAWRWSFCQPWKDDSSELSEAEKVSEYHACQHNLTEISKKLIATTLPSEILSQQDVEKWQAFRMDTRSTTSS